MFHICYSLLVMCYPYTYRLILTTLCQILVFPTPALLSFVISFCLFHNSNFCLMSNILLDIHCAMTMILPFFVIFLSQPLWYLSSSNVVLKRDVCFNVDFLRYSNKKGTSVLESPMVLLYDR